MSAGTPPETIDGDWNRFYLEFPDVYDRFARSTPPAVAAVQAAFDLEDKVVIDTGLAPRYVDISPYTLSYNTAELSTCISERTLAVVCVHPFGMPQPIAPADRLAHDAGAVREHIAE